jgi:hypothetical protein
MDPGIAEYRAEQNDKKLVVFASGTFPDFEYDACLEFTDPTKDGPTLRFSWRSGSKTVWIRRTRLFHTCAALPTRTRVRHVVVHDETGTHKILVTRHK